MQINKLIYFATVLILINLSEPIVAEEQVDASDPTRIYTYAGGGPKYTDYSNGESMLELRVSGNLGLSKSDMILFEFGYGDHDGDKVPGTNQGLTNSRMRWFHLFDMDYAITNGYRGLAAQVDLQLAGQIKGTDGQNTLALGAVPAFGINEYWSFFLPTQLVNTWDKKFEKYNGGGLGLSPLFVYTPKWWDGSYVQIWPNYTRFLWGDLNGEGSGNLDLTLGGNFTPTLVWFTTFQQNFDKDLKTYRRDRDAGLTNDWNLFFGVQKYF